VQQTHPVRGTLNNVNNFPEPSKILSLCVDAHVYCVHINEFEKLTEIQPQLGIAVSEVIILNSITQ